MWPEWVLLNATWLPYVGMALIGGAAAHVMAFERAIVKWTWSEHFGRLVICWIKAFFIASLIYWAGQEYRWSQPVCFLATGLFSVFATDAITSLYVLVRKRLFGITDPPKPEP